MSTLHKAQDALDEATIYAERLAISLARAHYQDVPQWKPLYGDLIGLLTQIDNMAAGMTRRAAYESAKPALPAPVAELVATLRNGRWRGGEVVALQAATALESLSRQLNEAEAKVGELELEAAKLAAPCQIDGCKHINMIRLVQRADEAEAALLRCQGALEKIKALVCGDIRPNWQDTFTATNTRSILADICDTALASLPASPKGGDHGG